MYTAHERCLEPNLISLFVVRRLRVNLRTEMVKMYPESREAPGRDLSESNFWRRGSWDI